MNVLVQTMVKENPEGAKAVFLQHPQLAYALFQAMLLMNAVDPNVLQASLQIIVTKAGTVKCDLLCGWRS